MLTNIRPHSFLVLFALMVGVGIFPSFESTEAFAKSARSTSSQQLSIAIKYLSKRELSKAANQALLAAQTAQSDPNAKADTYSYALHIAATAFNANRQYGESERAASKGLKKLPASLHGRALHAMLVSTLGMAQASQFNKRRVAERSLTNAVALLDKNTHVKSLEFFRIPVLSTLSDIAWTPSAMSTSKPLLMKLLKQLDKQSTPMPSLLFQTLDRLGMLTSQVDPGAGVKYLTRAVTVGRKLGPKKENNLSRIFTNLAYAHFNLGHFAQSKKNHTNAYNIRKRTLGANHVMTARSLYGIGMSAAATNDFYEAESNMKRALKIFDNQPAGSVDRPALLASLAGLARLYKKTNRRIPFNKTMARIKKIQAQR